MSTIEERLSVIRSELNLTTRAFAKRINISAGSITNMEKGRRIITDRTISDICKTFNVNEEWFRYGTGGNGNMFKTVSADEEIAAFFGDLLNPENQKDYEFAKKFIKALAKLDIDDWKVLEKFIEIIGNKKE